MPCESTFLGIRRFMERARALAWKLSECLRLCWKIQLSPYLPTHQHLTTHRTSTPLHSQLKNASHTVLLSLRILPLKFLLPLLLPNWLTWLTVFSFHLSSFYSSWCFIYLFRTSSQCSAPELRQPDNYQPSQCTCRGSIWGKEGGKRILSTKSVQKR